MKIWARTFLPLPKGFIWCKNYPKKKIQKTLLWYLEKKINFIPGEYPLNTHFDIMVNKKYIIMHALKTKSASYQ